LQKGLTSAPGRAATSQALIHHLRARRIRSIQLEEGGRIGLPVPLLCRLCCAAETPSTPASPRRFYALLLPTRCIARLTVAKSSPTLRASQRHRPSYLRLSRPLAVGQLEHIFAPILVAPYVAGRPQQVAGLRRPVRGAGVLGQAEVGDPGELGSLLGTDTIVR
jgi:hypothetical protein